MSLTEGFTLPVKKKKKRRVKERKEPVTFDDEYEELLKRAFEGKVTRVRGEKEKIMVEPPLVMRAGTKRTAFVNISSVCHSITRKPWHLARYLTSELGTTGNFDARGHFVLRGVFNNLKIQNVVSNYVKEYVICPSCRLIDTRLVKKEKILFLSCNNCFTQQSVSEVSMDFRAKVR